MVRLKKHPAYFYNLAFRVIMPNTQKWIAEIEQSVLTWHGVSAEIHPMGGVAFLFQRKEIGHVHWNGDLDIVFGEKLTKELLKTGKVEKHKFVPSSAVTFPLKSKMSIDFAVRLLHLSYLRILKIVDDDDLAIKILLK
jgi:hypothetical protein